MGLLNGLLEKVLEGVIKNAKNSFMRGEISEEFLLSLADLLERSAEELRKIAGENVIERMRREKFGRGRADIEEE